MNKNLIIIAAGVGGLIWLSRNQVAAPINGLGLWGSNPALDKMKKDPWLKVGSRKTSVGRLRSRYTTTVEFTPKINSSYWTINALALKPKPVSTSSGFRGRSSFGSRFNFGSSQAAHKMPIILKAKSIKQLKEAVASLEKNKAKAQTYVKMKSPPGIQGPTAAVWGSKSRSSRPASPGDWHVNTMATRYINIINGALTKAKTALTKAEKSEADDKARKDALARLRDVTTTEQPAPGLVAPRIICKPGGNCPKPKMPTPPPKATVPSDAPVKNSWQDLITVAPTQTGPVLPPKLQPMVPQAMLDREGGRSRMDPTQRMQQRVAEAPIQPAPDKEINPVVTGVAVAAPLILAALI